MRRSRLRTRWRFKDEVSGGRAAALKGRQDGGGSSDMSLTAAAAGVVLDATEGGSLEPCKTKGKEGIKESSVLERT